ncbi:glycoside hydrolase family 25 protein [Rhodococcoides fascians]|uniref:glycoside hydrolase family 25 protein n=1 Tax=Rhodococcoides fascians TaxID=1828 RepID=UPI00068FC71A|nr:glycoside hydrolase family 25 protein [Rhodococcus fascians]
MTIFGIDIASWQKGLNIDRVAAEGFRYIIAKATESNDYRNPEYAAQKAGARKNGLHFGAYHYLRADTSAKAQVDNYAALEPDKSVPVMLDHEAGSGDVRVLRAVHSEFVARGYRVNLTYLPNWYWGGTMGKPDLTGLPPLMSSNYGRERAGYASAIYPGDSDVGWNGYGGLDVAVFQFTQKASVAGQSIDANAFRGTEAQLAALFGSATPSGGTVADTPQLVLDQLIGPNGQGWEVLGRSKVDPSRFNTLVEAVAEVREALVKPRPSIINSEVAFDLTTNAQLIDAATYRTEEMVKKLVDKMEGK